MRMILNNKTARLLVGPTFRGVKKDQNRWIPGDNPIESEYWQLAKRNETIRTWLHIGYIEVDQKASVASPDQPPTEKELSEFPTAALLQALSDPSVPKSWHPAFEIEIEKRKDEAKEKRGKRLLGLKVDEALVLINEEEDPETLEAWADNDKRTSIKDAIDGKLNP